MLNATASTKPLPLAIIGTPVCWPVAMSQSRAVSSVCAVASVAPSGLNATASTPDRDFSMLTGRRLATSQSRTECPWFTSARVVPPALNSSPVAEPTAIVDLYGRPDARSHNRMWRSNPAAASSRPSGLNAVASKLPTSMVAPAVRSPGRRGRRRRRARDRAAQSVLGVPATAGDLNPGVQPVIADQFLGPVAQRVAASVSANIADSASNGCHFRVERDDGARHLGGGLLLQTAMPASLIQPSFSTCNGAYTYHIWLGTPGAHEVSVTGTVPDPVPADTHDPGAAAALSWR